MTPLYHVCINHRDRFRFEGTFIGLPTKTDIRDAILLEHERLTAFVLDAQKDDPFYEDVADNEGRLNQLGCLKEMVEFMGVLDPVTQPQCYTIQVCRVPLGSIDVSPIQAYLTKGA